MPKILNRILNGDRLINTNLFIVFYLLRTKPYFWIKVIVAHFSKFENITGVKIASSVICYENSLCSQESSNTEKKEFKSVKKCM